jgi:hypothetical protein
MLHHMFTVACQSVDRSGSSLSAIGVVERLHIMGPELPAVATPPGVLPFNFTVLTLWFNSGYREETPTERVRLVGPNGEKPPDESGENTLVVKPRGFGRVFTNFGGLPYFGNGVYWLETSMKKGGAWTPLVRVPVIVEASVMPAPAKRH